MAYMLLWLDLEATGSSHVEDYILEVGAVLTGFEYPWDEVESYEGVCRPFDWRWRDRMDDVVTEMHSRNGLAAAVDGSSTPLWRVESDLISMLQRHTRPNRVALAGSGVCHFDRRMIDAQMGRLSRWLRMAPHDIGDVRRFLKASGRSDLARPMVYAENPHRGLADIRDHLDEAREYARLIRSIEKPER